MIPTLAMAVPPSCLFPCQDIRDPFAGMAVAVWILGMGHGVIFALVGQKLGGQAEDRLGLRAREGDGAGQGMIPQMQEFYSHPETFSFGLDPEEDHFYFAMSEFDHMDVVMPFTLYNAKDILFK